MSSGSRASTLSRGGISHRATAVSFCWLVFDITGGIWSFRGVMSLSVGGTGGCYRLFRIGGNSTQRSQIIQNGIISRSLRIVLIGPGHQ